MARTVVEQRKPLSAEVSAADLKRLQELAREHDRSLSAEVRRALRLHLEQAEQEPRL